MSEFSKAHGLYTKVDYKAGLQKWWSEHLWIHTFLQAMK